jgi:L-threonylcarbamoyladenylate synthase
MNYLSADSLGIAQAAALLRSGKLVAFPTETFYALGALCTHENAIAAVFHGKGRNPSQPVALIAGDNEQAFALWRHLPPEVRALAETHWPGPLTLVLPARDGFSPQLQSPLGIGVRVSSHPTARALALAAGAPLVATSANLSGTPPVQQASQIQIAVEVPIVANDNGVQGGLPSTMVAYENNSWRLLRPGPIVLEGL